MKKLSKRDYGFIFAIVALTILLGISLYLGLSGWFFSNTTKLRSDLELGETVNLSLTGNETKLVSFTFPGSLLPGQNLQQFINVTNDSPFDLHVRAKAVIFDYENDFAKVEIGVGSHWTEHEPYYYFDQPLPKANKIALGSYIKLLPENFYDSHKSYVITIVVEGLDSSIPRADIWGF